MKVGLWDDMGGSVYKYHIKYCKDGRKKRREEPMIKRKFVALGAMQEKGPSNVKRPRISRNSMPNWHAKLESKFSIFSAGDCLYAHNVLSHIDTFLFTHNHLINRTGSSQEQAW